MGFEVNWVVEPSPDIDIAVDREPYTCEYDDAVILWSSYL